MQLHMTPAVNSTILEESVHIIKGNVTVSITPISWQEPIAKYRQKRGGV